MKIAPFSLLVVFCLILPSSVFASGFEGRATLENMPSELFDDSAANAAAEDGINDEISQYGNEDDRSPKEVVILDRLKVIGRGIQNRRTHEAILLTCVGPVLLGTNSPSCKQLRHIRVKENTREVSYIGKVYEVFGDTDSYETEEAKTHAEPTTADLKSRVRTINHASKDYKKYTNTDRRNSFLTTGTAIGVLSVGIGTIIASGGAVLLLPIFGSMAAAFGVEALIKHPLKPNSGAITEMMANQDGWSWSVSPKKVSQNSYHWFERYLNCD